jgi:short-chain fatty acids transporter
MIQAFWALPLLGIAKLGARDIMGYCLVILVYSGIVISLGLVFYSFFIKGRYKPF